MMTLVFGGSGSGKSAYAESLAVSRGEGMPLYYLATMHPFGPEGRERVRRHRDMRQGKGFCTIEQPVNVETSLEQMQPGSKTILLECLSNLVANELFDGEITDTPEAVCDQVIAGICSLQRASTHLILVSCDVFRDGKTYDESTTAYLQTLGSVHQQLCTLCEEVIEVVVGIPVYEKGGVQCTV
ncbi:MAG: bifunctional adenosylcobinamide kinase/adenosylcobinamide-phosphate guanylyltransferase [Oscillospiraceae bacterium]|nr:bifunctional adenosylcobinamide kinase/adenosylcobinamide-phosphate guanylyltransferase [Oscillospiraceae bacterium]